MTSFEPSDDLPCDSPETGASSSRLEAITQEIAERFRRNECPEVSEYAARFPEHADDIRELLPALAVLEKAGRGSPLEDAADIGDPPMLTELGPYTVLRLLGRGGMGTVYEARHAELGRRVALKVLPSHTADESYIQRFQHESRSVAKLEHPHIVSLFEAGELGGVHYIAMQYIDGQSLDQILHQITEAASDRNVARSPAAMANGSSFCGDDSQHFRRVALMGAEAASALAYAHDHGVLHRDVKPSNLLLDVTGKVWLADFGLARTTESNLTHTGDVLGTLRYMPPEGLSGQFDVRGDVYSLGATLYELLTLRPAFDQTDRARLLRQVVDEQPLAPRQHNPAIPVDLETIVLTAMAKDPAQRYRSAHALEDDLRRFLQRRPIQARPVSPLERSWRWCQRNRALAAMGAMLVILLVGGMIVSLSAAVHFNRLAGEREQALGQEAAAMELQAEALELAEIARGEANNQLYEAELAKANALRWSRQPGRKIDSLKGLAAAAALAPQLGKTDTEMLALRNAAINSLALSDLRTLQRWTEGMPDSFDRNLERAAHWVDGEVSIRRVHDGMELARLPGFGKLHEPYKDLILSPDGRHLVVRWNSSLNVWDIQAKRLVQNIRCSYGYARLTSFDLSFDRDGTTMVLTSREGDLQAWTLGAEFTKPLKSIHVDGQGLKAVLAPDGRRVAVTYRKGGAGEVRIWDLATGERLHADSNWCHGTAIFGVAWSPDGEKLAVGAEYDDGAVNIYDTSTGQLWKRLLGHENSVVGLAFTTDGQTVVSDSWDGTIRFWDLISGEESLRLNGGRLRVATSGNRMAVSESRDGRGHVSEFLPPVVLRRRPDSRQHEELDGRFVFEQTPGGFTIRERVRDTALATAELLKGDVPIRLQYRPESDELFVSSRGGVICFPTTCDESAGHLNVGPPELLSPYEPYDRKLEVSADGRWLAMIETTPLPNGKARPPRGLILDRQHPDCHIYVDHPLLKYLALSPDGQLTATTSWNGDGVKVWESQSGKLLKDVWPDSGSANVCFSPNGRWLVSWANDEYRMFEVGTWKLLHRFADGVQYGPSGRIAFSPDCDVMALRHHRSHARLVDPSSGRVLAVLQQQHGKRIAAQPVFSRDGRQLITRSTTTETWDLHRLRHELRRVGLDWSDEPLPPLEPAEVPGQSPTMTATVDVTGCDDALQAASHYRSGQFEQAIPLLRASLESNARQHCLWNMLGTCEFRLGLYEHAAASYAQAANLAPQSIGDRIGAGKSCLELAHQTHSSETARQAIHWFDQALELSPRHLSVHRLRGDARKLADDPAAAIANSRLAGVEVRTLSVAEEYRDQQQWAVAAERYSKLLAHKASSSQTRYQALIGRAVCHIELGRDRQALDDMNDAELLWYHQPVPSEDQAELLAAVWQDLVDRFPHSPAARLGLAHAYGWQAKWPDAVSAYEAGLELVQSPPVVPSNPLMRIDLTGSANVPLDAKLGNLEYNTFATLLPGEYQFDGVRFTVAPKCLALGNQHGRPDLPRAIENVPIDCFAQRLHFLHNSRWHGEPGSTIGVYRFHYDDDTSVDAPIGFERNVSDMSYPQLGSARIAWVGIAENSEDPRVSRMLSLVHWTWQNPHPEKRIARMDFIAGDEKSVPFCVAITAEHADISAAAFAANETSSSTP